MERLGIFGGTFNPPHKGHIYIANEAMRLAALDRIMFIPCGIPPHKAVEGDVEARHRLEMTRLAIIKSSDFEVSDIEVSAVMTNPAEKSYTAHTLKKLENMYPYSRLCLVVGGDSLRDMEGWFHPEEIFARAEIVAVNRGGIEEKCIAEKAEYFKAKYQAEITVVDVLPMEISSSEIRQKIYCGKDVSHMVQEEVLEYIKENKIYRNKN